MSILSLPCVRANTIEAFMMSHYRSITLFSFMNRISGGEGEREGEGEGGKGCMG